MNTYPKVRRLAGSTILAAMFAVTGGGIASAETTVPETSASQASHDSKATYEASVLEDGAVGGAIGGAFGW